MLPQWFNQLPKGRSTYPSLAATYRDAVAVVVAHKAGGADGAGAGPLAAPHPVGRIGEALGVTGGVGAAREECRGGQGFGFSTDWFLNS